MKTNKILQKSIMAAVCTAGMFISPSELFAQVKIGANPTTIGTNSNLEVEGTNGNKTVILKTNGNVGIGTVTPTAKLHVAGNQILGQASVVTSSEGTSQIVRDNNTGELKVLETTASNQFPITSITYQIDNVSKDWVSNYDTKISADDYVLIITGITFNKKFLRTQANSEGGVYNPLNFGASVGQQTNTWRLFADYNGGSTADDSNGSWTIRCIAINKSIIQTLPVQTADLGGLSTGAAPSAPAGL